MEEKYFVYILIDPRNDKPFYVGKGIGKRFSNHLKEYYKQIDYYKTIFEKPEKILSLKHNTIHELINEGLEYKYNLIEGLNEDDAYLLEHSFIAWFGRQICGNGILTNLLSGGKNGELFFDDEQLVRVFERKDLLDEILKYPKTSTKWTARTLYFYNPNNLGYPFTELKMDWLYNYHQCNQQFAIKVIEKLKQYDAVITPYYWVRKLQKKDYLEDSVYIMEESFELMEGTNYKNHYVDDFNTMKTTYLNLTKNKNTLSEKF